MTGEEIRQRLLEITKARIDGRIDLILSHFSPDALIHRNCLKRYGFSTSGVSHGREAYAADLRESEEEFEVVDGEIQQILVEGPLNAMRWRTRWRHRGTGRLWPLDTAHFLRWRHGLIVEMHEYTDTPVSTPDAFSVLRPLANLITPPEPGLTREEMVDRVQRLADYHTPRGPDLNLLRLYYAPNIVCEFVGDRMRIPYAGRHIGVEAVINIVGAIDVDFEQLDFSLSDILVDGGALACRRSVEWRHRGTGRRGVVELAEFVRFENGEIVELVEYRDSVRILEMQGDLEAR
ncbi:MAG TPA: nuclear transport factor 2 family protein [Methylocystis sp.]|nr:nuclear transport factor 2 family protein [Methylocystis sp.]